MEATRYKIHNKTRDSAVSTGVTLVNSAREPLTALRVMVEGLGAGEDAGLWLTQVTTVPMVPRISPFDLVYLDVKNQVVACVELLPASEIPRFKKPATSALVLPFRTISAAEIKVGDELTCDEVLETETVAEAVVSETAIVVAEKKQTALASTTQSVVKSPKPTPEADLQLLNPFLVRATPSQECAPLDILKAADLEPADKPREFVLTDFLRSEAAKPSGKGDDARPAQQDATRMFIAPKRGAAKRPKRAPLARSVTQKPEPPRSGTPGKKPKVDRLFRWLYPALYDQNRRAAERHSSAGMVAYDFAGDEPRMHQVADVSSHGLYLKTEEPWEPGKVLSLTLQPNGPFENDSQARVDFDCAVVRLGADGFGMSILLPEGMELKLWEAPGRNGADETDPHCILRELRMARALAFMRRICPGANAQVTDLLHKTLSNVRAANIVEVALRAEKILAEEPDAYCLAAHPGLILSILEHGSWVDVDWLQDLWAGLLATSCTFEGQDESNLIYVNLLSRLAPLPTQILTMACANAVQSMTESANLSLPAYSAEEIAQITRSNNMLKIYKSIGELSELGLVEKNPRTVSHANPEAAKALPTQLALQMFARCNGQRSVTLAA